jgi:hypothetical protein
MILLAGIQHHAFSLDRLSECVVDVLQTHEVDVQQRWRLVDDAPKRRPLFGRGAGTRDPEVDVRSLVVVATAREPNRMILSTDRERRICSTITAIAGCIPMAVALAASFALLMPCNVAHDRPSCNEDQGASALQGLGRQGTAG